MKPNDFSRYKKRRDNLISQLKKRCGGKPFNVVLFADYEQERVIFRQESSFYYLTGVTEPGAVVMLCSDGTDYLYLPNFGTTREKWVVVDAFTSKRDGGATAKRLQFSDIKDLGNERSGFMLSSYFDGEQYCCLIDDLKKQLAQSARTYTLVDSKSSWYDAVTNRFDMVADCVPGLHEATEDCAEIVHEMRRCKDVNELQCLQKAIDITSQAHLQVARVLAAGKKEYQIRAELEKVFIESGATNPAFPSIVATGVNTTILHYTQLDQTLHDGDLVVVDIGAEYCYYAADLTRTFPVNGRFTDRQREIYNIVLQAQEYIETMVKPGMFLRNTEQGEQSLQYLTTQFFKQRSLDQYYFHGVGHYLGLEVHDVGTYKTPLKPGDVFTIEPGIYIKDEALGVRIEDDYLVTESGCKKLSSSLPSKVEAIEELMLAR